MLASMGVILLVSLASPLNIFLQIAILEEDIAQKMKLVKSVEKTSAQQGNEIISLNREIDRKGKIEILPNCLLYHHPLSQPAYVLK